MKIQGIIDSTIRLRRDALRPELFSDLRDALTRENPGYHQMRRLQQANPHKYRHTKMPPATIVSLQVDDSTVYVPRGCLPLVRELAAQHDQTLDLFDERLILPRRAEWQMAPGFELLPYQRKALAEAVTTGEGVIVAPCGSGKTVTGIATIVTLAQPTLILVHMLDLVKQWRSEIAAKANLPFEVGQYGGGQKNIQDVTVATIQTLTKMSADELRKFLSRFGCVVLDEAHHCPATTFMGVMNLSPARYRLGLTATPMRKDRLEFLMHDTIGPTLLEITDSDLESAGRTQTVHVIQVATDFYTRYGAHEWTQMLADMVADKDRNRLIADCVKQSWDGEHFPLVLSDRVGHCRSMAYDFGQFGMQAEVMTGSVPKHARENITKRARANQVDVIVATKVADEGLDIPQLSCVHLTTPTSNEGKLQQRIGRIRRPIEGKVSVLYDYVDVKVPACVRMARSRMRLYKKWGFTIHHEVSV